MYLKLYIYIYIVTYLTYVCTLNNTEIYRTFARR